MAIIKSKINTNSADFTANTEKMKGQVDDLCLTLDKIYLGGGKKPVNVT